MLNVLTSTRSSLKNGLWFFGGRSPGYYIYDHLFSIHTVKCAGTRSVSNCVHRLQTVCTREPLIFYVQQGAYCCLHVFSKLNTVKTVLVYIVHKQT